MWRRTTLCVAGLAGITVGAALAQETTRVSDLDAPQGSFVSYLADDPPPAQAAGRVLRLLEILGVHRPLKPNQPPARTGTETDLPPPPAETAAPREPVAAVAFQDEVRTSPFVTTSPHFFMPHKERTSAWPINDLREPARTDTTFCYDEGMRHPDEPDTDAPARSSESVADLVRPVPRNTCPDGMTSSRRTIQAAAGGMSAAQAPAVETSAATKAPAATRATANFSPDSQSVTPMASLPPLPSLRTDNVSVQLAASGNRATGLGLANSQPMPAVVPSAWKTNAHASQDSVSGADGTEPLPAYSEGSFFEPRSTDAVLEPLAVPVIKAYPAGRQGNDEGRAKISANVEFAPMAMPSLKRRLSVLPSPEMPPQRVAASWRQPSNVGVGTASWAMLPQLRNNLRDRPRAAMADLPRQIPQQLPPPLSPPLPPRLPLRLPQPNQGRSEVLAAVAEPALLRVGVRESHLLRTSENVVRVVSEHDGVCDVLLFNPREIAVIGKQRGTVKVEFWYDGQGAKRASYLVAVEDGRNPQAQPEADYQKIERLVACLFPKSRVELVSDQDRLIVRGSAVSQRQAVEIISTVRRSQLIPVADEIVVQREAR